MWLNVRPENKHQVTNDACHAALDEFRVERVHPKVQHLRQHVLGWGSLTHYTWPNSAVARKRPGAAP